MKKLLLLLSGLFALLACFVGAVFIVLYMPVVSQEKGASYYLKPGMSKKAFITDVGHQGIIPFPSVLSLYAHTQPSAQLKTGEYLFPKGSSVVSIWHQVTTGKGLLYHTFTIIPGWTFHQLRQSLAQHDNLRPLTANLTDQQIMAQLGSPNLHPEGQFFPESYYYTKDSPDLVILKRAFDYMQKRLQESWETRSPNLPYRNAYDALIVASMVEKEAYLNSERPLIASVIVNRLRKNMLLQIDPTVIYGMGDRYQGKIHRSDLQENTPYNTYVHIGLPPTPIAMPSAASIEAAVHPQQTDYLYFVVKEKGSHQFSKTLTDHRVAVDAYIHSSLKNGGYFNTARLEFYLRTLITKNLDVRTVR